MGKSFAADVHACNRHGLTHFLSGGFHAVHNVEL